MFVEVSILFIMRLDFIVLSSNLSIFHQLDSYSSSCFNGTNFFSISSGISKSVIL